jgi:hypothetical protein
MEKVELKLLTSHCSNDTSINEKIGQSESLNEFETSHSCVSVVQDHKMDSSAPTN